MPLVFTANHSSLVAEGAAFRSAVERGEIFSDGVGIMRVERIGLKLPGRLSDDQLRLRNNRVISGGAI
jgi:hypothetical protein